MTDRITLAPRPLQVKKLFIDGFYIIEDNELYWLGHQYGKVGEYHQVPISKEFYDDFLKEKQRQAEKIKSITNSRRIYKGRI